MAEILVIDDDRTLGAMLEPYLGRFAMKVTHVTHGAEGLERAKAPGWDAIVLDVMLPGLDGFGVLKALRAANVATPILMLTACDGDEEKIDGLETGADDYLTKPFNPRELAARLRALLRRGAGGSAPAGDGEITVGDLSFRPEALAVAVAGAVKRLTHPEMCLLRVLAAAPGELVERKKLYQEVFYRSAFAYDRSLDMLVSRLRRKLGPTADGTDRIQSVWGRGYTLVVPGGRA